MIHGQKRVAALLVLLAVVAAPLVVSGVAVPASPESSYKCYVSDSLTAGIVPNTVQAIGDVNCSGYGAAGSVAFTVRIKRYDGPTQTYVVVGTKAKRYTTLRVRHRLVVSLTPCVPGAYRGTYTAVLRSARGGLVSVNLQKLQTLQVTPGCGVK